MMLDQLATMADHIVTTAVPAADPGNVPTGADFKDWVLVIAGNIFIAILVLRSIGHYFKREWGELFGHLAAGVLVGGLIYANNETINVLKGFWGLISGGS
jgi:hypothetical protein